MRSQEFSFADPQGINVFVYRWLPEEIQPLRGVVQIAQGMAETAGRYESFAESLTEAGYAVYANDHRGHGRTAKSLEELGDIGDDGYNWMVRNLKQLNDIIHSEYPSLPIFLFGHSMGSFLSQTYIAKYAATISGVILSGTGGKQGPIIHVAIALAKREMQKKGATVKSPTLNGLLFRNNNRSFAPARTEFDWLTRDAAQVDRYINDPYCGNVLTTGFYYHFLRGLANLHAKASLAEIPQNLPVFLLSGNQDPVGNYGKGVAQLEKIYRSLGLTNVRMKLYPGGRHEMLNETNRAEVIQDIIAWLDAH